MSSTPSDCCTWVEFATQKLPVPEVHFRPNSRQAQQERKEIQTLWILSAASCPLGLNQFPNRHHQQIAAVPDSCVMQSWLTAPQAQLYCCERFSLLHWYQQEQRVFPVHSHEAMQTSWSNRAAAVPQKGPGCPALYLQLNHADPAHRLSPSPCCAPGPWAGSRHLSAQLTAGDGIHWTEATEQNQAVTITVITVKSQQMLWSNTCCQATCHWFSVGNLQSLNFATFFSSFCCLKGNEEVLRVGLKELVQTWEWNVLVKGSFRVEGTCKCAMPHKEDIHSVGGVYKNKCPLRGKSGSAQIVQFPNGLLK